MSLLEKNDYGQVQQVNLAAKVSSGPSSEVSLESLSKLAPEMTALVINHKNNRVVIFFIGRRCGACACGASSFSKELSPHNICKVDGERVVR